MAANANTDTHYIYDSLGRLDTVTQDRRNGQDVTPETTDYVYDLLGNLRQERLPNGVVSDYTYDQLNRLELLREFKDGAGSQHENQYESGVDTLLAEYDYDLAADGRRTGVTEKTLVDSVLEETRIDWLYDDLGRLVREVHNAADDSLDFVADYTLDLAGNRLEKKTDATPSAAEMVAYHADVADGVADVALVEVNEEVSSTVDVNDRLLTEAKDLAGTADDRFTVYEYGLGASGAFGGLGTQQTSKTVHEGVNASGDVVEATSYSYNLQGRMSQTLVDSDGDGLNDAKYDYAYSADGIRVSQTATEDTGDDGQFDDETPVETVYLYDPQNPTGYAQILEEKNAAGAVTKTYTLGQDVLAQQAALIQSGAALFLLRDGHGSTRALLDATGQPLSGQIFAYDAFGIRLDAAEALTSLLYSGEQTDAATGLQYLRARYYDPATGRFNRLDPFAGNLSDPQSLHKYSYCHADPVMGLDPTGEFLLPIAIFVMPKLQAMDWKRVAMGVGAAYIGLNLIYMMLESHPNDAPYGTYQARLRYIVAYCTEMRLAGDAYEQGGVQALDKLYGTTGFHGYSDETGSKSHTIPKRWGEISSHIRTVVRKYNEIGRFGVGVAEYATLGGEGINNPYYPGLTLEHDCFWQNDINNTAKAYLHEGLHCIGGGSCYTGIGHRAHSGLIEIQDDEEYGKPRPLDAYAVFSMWMDYTKDASGRSVHQFVRARAASAAPPPPRP